MMNAKTLTALKGSIDKWQKIVDGTGVDDGALNCPLCRLFDDTCENDDTCEKCPVAIKSGKSNCDNTPYPKWRDHQKSIHYASDDWNYASDDWTVKCRWCRQFAEEELEFPERATTKEKGKNMIKQYWRCHRTEDEELVGNPREGRVVFVEELQRVLKDIKKAAKELKKMRKEEHGGGVLLIDMSIQADIHKCNGEIQVCDDLFALLESPSAKKDKEKEERKSNG